MVLLKQLVTQNGSMKGTKHKNISSKKPNCTENHHWHERSLTELQGNISLKGLIYLAEVICI